uniref:Seminal fluid protein CSSFP006 n=1 Tax=Chilo suppressalis TaxID=168631 RepID=G9F9F7_CHISP|nr:seminal fluid protein CSSFP006 [Chilo suppressalis]
MYFMCLFIVASLLANSLCEIKDGKKAPRIQLSDGNAIPALGLGTFLGFDEHGQKEVTARDVEDPVTWALDAGYRLIDTASAYNNEQYIGNAIRKTSVRREDIFLVTKLSSKDQRRVLDALKESLERLNVTYVDLYLIHNPVAFKPDESGFDIVDYVDTWKGLEEAKKLGLAKSIGISNFNESQIERLMANCEVKPTVLQVEVNLNLAQPKLLDFCKRHDIVVMAYTPFGTLFQKGGETPPPKSDDPTLVEIADKYKKTTPQIVLKYLVQLGVVPIPKSTRKNRIEENIDIFDFELSNAEMDTLRKFNKNYRTVFPSFWQDHPYYPYEKEDVPDPDPFKGNH